MSQLCLASLNSGSNGNCYYVGNEQDAVLVDAGISCREIGYRLARLGLSLSKVRAVLISHDHSDHIRGLEVFSGKYRIPVFITPATYENSRLRLDPGLVKPFTANEPLYFRSLTVNPFSKPHDTVDPHSFTVTSGGITAGVFTDIGELTEQVAFHFSRCHAAFLEANYDETMLKEGPYPVYLKRRISGGKGHLSNLQAFEIFNNFRAPYLDLLVLSHLSAQNNHPQILKDLFNHHANGTRIAIAPRYNESEIFLTPGFPRK